jgi:hypothetical protein
VCSGEGADADAGGAVRKSRVEVRRGVVSEQRASESGRCEMDKGDFITMRCDAGEFMTGLCLCSVVLFPGDKKETLRETLRAVASEVDDDRSVESKSSRRLTQKKLSEVDPERGATTASGTKLTAISRDLPSQARCLLFDAPPKALPIPPFGDRRSVPADPPQLCSAYVSPSAMMRNDDMTCNYSQLVSFPTHERQVIIVSSRQNSPAL